MAEFMSTTMDRSVARVGIVGVPFNKGQQKSGVSLAPQAIRKAGLVEEIKEFNQWVDIRDYGDVYERSAEIANAKLLPKNMPNYAIFAGTMQRLSDKVLEVYRDNRMCWTIGGDHSIAVGKFKLSANLNSIGMLDTDYGSFLFLYISRLDFWSFAS